MCYLLDAAYLCGLTLVSPWLLYRLLTTGRYRHGVAAKLLGTAPLLSDNDQPRAWFHGVSVGEIHLLRQVVAGFRRRHPDWDCVISTSTDTGYAEACKHFPDLHVFHWPFDFSWAVRHALLRVRPALVVLAEGELWPNFLLAAHAHGVPVAVINGRHSPRTAHRYQRLGRLVRPLFACVDLFVAQNEEYAACYRAVGAPPERVHVTGSVKYDGVETDRHNRRTEELRHLLALRPGEMVWVAGSTQAPEEEIVLDIFQRLRAEQANLRLLLVPRHQDRFDEVAALLQRAGIDFVRRSTLTEPLRQAVPAVLGDTTGELAALWGLADVAFVGGSLDGKRGGQNMIEPAAYGAAVVFGPHVWNFRDTAERLVQAGGALQVTTPAELESVVRRLLHDTSERARLGSAANHFVLQQQGATARTLDLLDQLLHTVREQRQVA